MKYISHYIWESGSEEKGNPVSVVLQQVKLKKHQCLLVCVCDGGKGEDGSLHSGYFTERLVEWFHRKCLLDLQKYQGDGELPEALSKELTQIEAELQEHGRQKNAVTEYDVLGMLVYDNVFCSFARGSCKGYLFNRRFNRKQRRDLGELIFPEGITSEMKLRQGSLQKGIGILICNPAFDINISEEEMVSVLAEEHLEEWDIQKRLRELWSENVQRGEQGNAGAVFFRTE